MVNLKLSFSISEFSYSEEIQVQKNKLLKNRLLSVQIDEESDLKKKMVAHINFSPLPYFHLYSLEEWKYTLDSFFHENEISTDMISLTIPYFNMIKNPRILYDGELLFIIESVLFAVIENKASEKLSYIKNRKIKINGLYSQNNKQDNYKTIECLKIKIRPTADSLLKTKLIIQQQILLNPAIIFRLDGNQSFELEELIFFLNQLESTLGLTSFHSIEYLEEPLKNINDYLSFFHLLPYPLALDESLIGLSKHLEFFREFPIFTHLVLKPSLLGISKCFEIMETAKSNGQKVIISSSYETLSAMRPLFFLAADNPKNYHGFDTFKFLPFESSHSTNNFDCVL